MSNDGSSDYTIKQEQAPTFQPGVQPCIKTFPPTTHIERRIADMNNVFRLPCHRTLTQPEPGRVQQFHQVLQDEVNELLETVCPESGEVNMVTLADTLADIRVYIESEARRCGIPLDRVTHIVLDSQDSKLVNGQPVMAEDGSKFIKGPNYQPPEKDIYKLLYEFERDEKQEGPTTTLFRIKDYFSNQLIEHAGTADFDPESEAIVKTAINVLSILND